MTLKKLNVLVATDFSPESKDALKTVNQLSTAFELAITLINVIPSYWKLWLYGDAYKKGVMTRLQSFREQFLKDKNVKKIITEVGNPADYIIEAALSVQAKLIIVGEKKSSTAGRYRSGTTLKGIIRGAHQSVLICKGERPFLKILVGLDVSSHSRKVLTWARDLAQSFKAELHIVTVLEKVDFSPIGLTDREIKSAETKYKKEHEQKFDSLLTGYDFSGIKVKRAVLWGHAAGTILDLAEDKDFDLIVVGAKGHSKLKSALLGSTAEKISSFTPCSLLVVR